jgi:hypothetical protein
LSVGIFVDKYKLSVGIFEVDFNVRYAIFTIMHLSIGVPQRMRESWKQMVMALDALDQFNDSSANCANHCLCKTF